MGLSDLGPLRGNASKPDGCPPVPKALPIGGALPSTVVYQTRLRFVPLAQKATPLPLCLLVCPCVPAADGVCTHCLQEQRGLPLFPVLLVWSVPSPLPSGGDTNLLFQKSQATNSPSFPGSNRHFISQGGGRRRCLPQALPSRPPPPLAPLAARRAHAQPWPMRWGKLRLVARKAGPGDAHVPQVTPLLCEAWGVGWSQSRDVG